MEADQPISVLLVEDDDRLARFVAEYLEQQGVRVTRAADGEQGVREALGGSFDVVVLDLMLPRKDGLAVCREVRARSAVPILMVTARTDEADRVVGLEMGADDYISKPFSMRELLARVRASVRRARGQLGGAGKTLTVGPLVLHLEARSAQLSGKPLELTTYEFDILRVLAERRGRVLSREQIIELARGAPDEAFDRSIDVRVSRLRAKLGEDPRHKAMIRTVRGAGYMLAWEGDG